MPSWVQAGLGVRAESLFLGRVKCLGFSGLGVRRVEGLELRAWDGLGRLRVWGARLQYKILQKCEVKGLRFRAGHVVSGCV